MIPELIITLITLAIVGPFIAAVIYYYYHLTRKRREVTRNDIFVLLIGSFVAGMLFLSLMRTITGAHTNGLLDPNRHSTEFVCPDCSTEKQAE